MIIKILQKHKPTKREMQFVVQALISQPIFEQNSNMLLDIINNMSVFKEFKVETFNPLQAIFQKGDVGKKFYIVIKEQQIRHKNSSECTPYNQKKTDDLNQQQQQQQSIYQVNQKDSITYNEYIYLKNKYPLQKVTKIYKSGESFGEIALLTRGQRMGTMVCRTDVEVISLTREGFNRIKGAWAETELNKKLNFLRKFSFFRGLSDSRLMSFLHLMEINKYEKENILYQKNEKSKYIYFIFEGQVKIFTYKVDNYPLLYKNQTRQIENPEIQKYLKHTKPKLKKVPLMILASCSYFGQFEMFEENEEIKTMAVVESERAVLFQIEITKFIETMKGFNGDYDFKRDFKQKLLFEKERLENITNTDTQINQNVINIQNQHKNQDFKKQIFIDTNIQSVSNQFDNKSCGRLESNNSSICIENHQLNDSHELKQFSGLQNVFKEKKRHKKQNNSLKLQKDLSEDSSQKYFHSATSSPQLEPLPEAQPKSNRKLSSQENSRFFQTSQLEVDFINESSQDEGSSYLPQIRQKMKSQQGEIFRTRQNSEVNLYENINRKRNKSTSNDQLDKINQIFDQNQKQISCQKFQPLEENKFSMTNREYSDHSPLSSNSKIIKFGSHDNSQLETLTQHSRQQSYITENSKRNSIYKINQNTPQSNKSGQFEKDYFKSFFKTQIEQISQEKEQNLKILNYKELNLKSIGISPSDLIEQCRKLQRFGFEKGQMSGQMKKTVLAFTNRGLFSQLQDQQISKIQKENSDQTKKKAVFKQNFGDQLNVSNEKNTDQINELSFKNTKIKDLLQNVQRKIKEEKNQQQIFQIDETQTQSQALHKDLCQSVDKEKCMESQDQAKNILKSTQLNRQQREQLEQQIRKFQQLQSFKNIFSLDERNQIDNIDVKIKSARIFPMRENLQLQTQNHQTQKDLFQIKKFSLQSFAQNNNNKCIQHGGQTLTERSYSNKESLYFPSSPQQEYKQVSEKKQKVESNNSNAFVAIASVRPYYTNHPGVPKNTYIDTQEQIKQYDKLKDYFLIEKNYETLITQNQNVPQDKKQKEIIQNLMLSPRMNHLHAKNFDVLKNMHVNRQKLNNHKRNKSLN
ncbi:cyclic nucleotide-binding domain protein (macronuclear) [Tetrahymena thermophila SB210]|uniref:Cyclic nucleotide-binding domain protein n=1 Tax=Tetrahymena thermophila (strain SB210) TaxID=312017 RepID=I7M6K0_TETTS|nr:cyclic nucleotide-binding domain protein [Tetrahymena thermophila SB210]EAR85351.2 cyclic nucleotide-binding domain protein [Tetrahymena thermophila SB210]|eukprot:XP_001033014.2 cyclic nucleotide-binding domain protein [Tetrahymena thermophila SB210]